MLEKVLNIPFSLKKFELRTFFFSFVYIFPFSSRILRVFSFLTIFLLTDSTSFRTFRHPFTDPPRSDLLEIQNTPKFWRHSKNSKSKQNSQMAIIFRVLNFFVRE